MNNFFMLDFSIAGTLAANFIFRWTAPFNCTLVHVSAVSSNAGSATLDIGTSGDDDEFMLETAIGVSGTPVEWARTDFVGDQFPRIEDGDIFLATLDYDGASATAAANVTVVMTFKVG